MIKHNITQFDNYKKPKYNEDFFNNINTKEKAYIIGFLLANSALSIDDKLRISIALKDKEILDFIQSQIGGVIRTSEKIDKRKRLFPKATMSIGNPKIIRNIKMLFGGRLKEDRHIPIIKKDLERYLLQGFFDGDGCITWGYRKDRTKIWQKVSFTSQLKLLEGIQKILINNNISSIIRPKTNKKCYVIEICTKKEVLKLLDLIYPDDSFTVLKRKYIKSNALRLELEGNGEGANKQ